MGSHHSSQVKASFKPSQTSECYEADMEEFEEWLCPLGFEEIESEIDNHEIFTIEFQMQLKKENRVIGKISTDWDILKCYFNGKNHTKVVRKENDFEHKTILNDKEF